MHWPRQPGRDPACRLRRRAHRALATRSGPWRAGRAPRRRPRRSVVTSPIPLVSLVPLVALVPLLPMVPVTIVLAFASRARVWRAGHPGHLAARIRAGVRCKHLALGLIVAAKTTRNGRWRRRVTGVRVAGARAHHRPACRRTCVGARMAHALAAGGPLVVVVADEGTRRAPRQAADGRRLRRNAGVRLAGGGRHDRAALRHTGLDARHGLAFDLGLVAIVAIIVDEGLVRAARDAADGAGWRSRRARIRHARGDRRRRAAFGGTPGGCLGLALGLSRIVVLETAAGESSGRRVVTARELTMQVVVAGLP